MAGRLGGKVAIVTGAARGQGEAVARAVATSLGAAVRYFHCDISCEEEVRAAVAGTVATFGKLDVRYNNGAVITYGNRIADMPVEQWDRTMAINLRGPFLCSKHSLPHLVAQGGWAIVIVSSHGAFQASRQLHRPGSRADRPQRAVPRQRGGAGDDGELHCAGAGGGRRRYRR